MKQCLGLAESIQRMAGDGTLPRLDPPQEQGAEQNESPPEEKQKPASDDPASHLKVIK
jgi:hypothetical protein